MRLSHGQIWFVLLGYFCLSGRAHFIERVLIAIPRTVRDETPERDGVSPLVLGRKPSRKN